VYLHTSITCLVLYIPLSNLPNKLNISALNFEKKSTMARTAVDQGFPILAKKGLQRGASPLPEREVSSHPPFLPVAAGGQKQNWKTLRC
jgi:hypothetical protein